LVSTISISIYYEEIFGAVFFLIAGLGRDEGGSVAIPDAWSPAPVSGTGVYGTIPVGGGGSPLIFAVSPVALPWLEIVPAPTPLACALKFVTKRHTPNALVINTLRRDATLLSFIETFIHYDDLR